ncbi:hypothetical protein A2W24_04140 [Microgenomates group bacterium RBG_16_45_19]|nr:MAG: hypothetical protein A2W24_04140 [Microgenomates group bacterium RBG_16_45_19]
MTRLQRQQGWLIDLQRRLQPTQDQTASQPRGQDIETQVDRYLAKLREDNLLNETDRSVAQHLVTTFRNRWWGLFVCYDVPGLPATNNDLEGFFGRLKTNQRRITGRKSVNSFVLRYGAYATLVDLSESKADLLARLRQVDRAAYQRERQQLQLVLAERQDYHRFCHHLDTVVQALETEWQAAVEVATRSLEAKNLS